MKAVKVAALVLGSVALAAAIGVLGTRKGLARLDATLEADLARWRAEPPPPRAPWGGGVRASVNAADEYEALCASVARDFPRLPPGAREEGSPGALGEAAAGPPGSLPGWVGAWVGRFRAEIDGLHVAVRAERCVWATAADPGRVGTPGFELPGAHPLVELAIVDGHRRAAAGDGAGAAEVYLDVARFGLDLARAGDFVSVYGGEAMARRGLAATQALVAARALDAAALGRVEEAARALEASLPDLARTVRIHRIEILRTWQHMARTGEYAHADLPAHWRLRPSVALGWAAHDRPFRAAEVAMGLADLDARSARVGAIDADARASFHPLARTLFGFKHIVEDDRATRRAIADLRAAAATARVSRGGT